MLNKRCISNERQNRGDFAPWPSSVKISSTLLTGGSVLNQNGHFGSMFNKYHRASWNCWVQQIPCPIMCNVSKPQLCVYLCSQTKVTSNTWYPKLWWWVCSLISLLAEVLSHFTIGNLNSHSCKVYSVGSNYNCMPNTILSNIYIFSHVDLHKNSPCQLYDLSNLSLFHVQHLDHSSVHWECRKFSMSLDMSLLNLFISCLTC
jgi:hypothetical protein